ncbi:MAG: radical SAM protein [Myxococcales bacterium]|nr:radical SAM protein [Myxococcales bacterium]
MAEWGSNEAGVMGSFFGHAIQRAIPLFVQWDLTWRCDHQCVHCYLLERRQDELTLEEGVRILDELSAAGTLFLLLSGGDLFLRKDALDIIRAARARQFDVKINTHGNFIDDALADALAEVGVSKVAMSLYSVDAAEHEAITRIAGSHQKTIDAARRLRARGVAVGLKTPLMVHNRKGYQGVGVLAKELGADWESDAHIVPDDGADFGLCTIGAHSTDRILGVMRGFEAVAKEVKPLDELGETPSDRVTCSAGTASAYISPDGTLYPCINWRDPVGQLRDHGFAELWWGEPGRDATARQREIRRASYLGDCGGCTFHGKCGYCPGLSHAETGDAGRRSAYVCERTHLTMAALEYVHACVEEGRPIPAPDTPEATALFEELGPSYAERQWAARSAGQTKQRDQLSPRTLGGLLNIEEPRG